MRARRAIGVGATCAAVLAAAAGCGRREDAAGGGTDRLVIISPHWEGIQHEFTRAFAEWYRARTGRSVDMDWIDQGGTTDDLRYVRSEFQRRPEGIGIDVFFGGGIDVFMRMADEGLLTAHELPAEILDPIPASVFGVPLYDSQHRWYGAVISGFGVILNRSLMERYGLPEVVRWSDLGRPEFLGRVAAADPRKSGSAHMIYEIILQSLGWEEGFRTLTAIAGNARTFLAGSNEIPKAVTSGEAVAGMAIDFYAYNEMDAVGADKIGFVIPEGARLFNPDPVAILKGAANRAVAEAFVEFVMSEPGQRLWMQRKGTPGGPRDYALNRASVLPSLYELDAALVTVRANPFALESTVRYDNDKGSRRTMVLNDLLGALFIESHDELRRAWRSVVDAGLSEDAVAELGAVPVTEDEAMELAARFQDDAELRNRRIAEWTRYAREKYRRIAGR